MGVAPTASVIIPCWNSGRFLQDCLDSLLANSFGDFEVLAIDDGSSDSTRAILDARSAADPRIRVFSLGENRGTSAARNTGLANARGRIILFVDPDDTVSPDMVGAFVARLDETHADFAIAPYAARHDPRAPFVTRPLRDDYDCASNAEIRARFLPRVFGYSIDHVREWNRGAPLFQRVEMGSVCRCGYRRDLLERHRIRFDETLTLSEDAMFNSEVAIHASSMAALKSPHYFYTVRPEGNMMSRDGGASMFANKLRQLRRREELDRAENGALADAFAGSCVFTLLELLHLTRKVRIPYRESAAVIAEYSASPTVRRALARFPLSIRHPLVAAAVIPLRMRLAMPLHALAYTASRILPRSASRYGGIH